MTYPNNMMAFCADRGQGKTTAMRSFAGALQKLSGGKSDSNNCPTADYSKLTENNVKANFSVLNIIDPTLMNEQDSIVKTILSRMMLDVSVKWENFDADKREEHTFQKQKLLDRFQQCFSDIRELNTDSWKNIDHDDLEKLMKYGDSTNIKVNLYRLVRKYLDFMNDNGESDSNMLMIQIDDADMNIKATYRIVDEIRKYLCIPQVVVLMSVNPIQLGRTIEQHFIDQYKTDLKYNGNIDIQQCHMIAEKYIEKFMPAYRQIFLPEINLESTGYFKNIVIKYYCDKEKNVNKLIEDENRITYQEQLAEFVRRKTGIVLIPSNAFLHNFLPSNMRELTHFLAYFNQYNDDERSDVYLYIAELILKNNGKLSDDEVKWIDTRKKTITGVEEYLINIWAQTNLSYQGSFVLRQLRNTAGYDKNRNALIHIIRYYDNEVKPQNSGRTDASFIELCEERGVNLPVEEVKHLKEEDNNGEIADELDLRKGLTYADIYEALNVLTDLSGSNQYKFAYAIRLYYSIYLQLLFLDAAKRGAKVVDSLNTYNFIRGINTINSFIGDVFFRKYPIRSSRLINGFNIEYETSDKIPFTKYNVNKERLINILRQYAGADLEIKDISSSLLRVLSTWCRIEIPFSRGTVMACPEAGFFTEETEMDDKIYFNIFYILMHTIDDMSDSKNAYNEEDRARLSAVIKLMSNWDIQYELHKKLRDNPIAERNVYKIIRRLYKDCLIDLLKKYDLFDANNTDNLFGLPADFSEIFNEEKSDIINEITQIIYKKYTVDGSKEDVLDMSLETRNKSEKEYPGQTSFFDTWINKNFQAQYISEMKENEAVEAIYMIQCCNDNLLYMYISNMKKRLERFVEILEIQSTKEIPLAMVDWSKTDNDNRLTWTVFIQENRFLKFLVKYKKAILKRRTNRKVIRGYDKWIPLPNTPVEECIHHLKMYIGVLADIMEEIINTNIIGEEADANED